MRVLLVAVLRQVMVLAVAAALVKLVKQVKVHFLVVLAVMVLHQLFQAVR
jgi:hypothetical protein